MSRHHTRLHAGRWARVRWAELDAAGWRCAICGRYANEVDHIVPLHKGGDPWAESNLQAICRSDHIRKTAAENRRPPTPAEAAWRDLVRAML